MISNKVTFIFLLLLLFWNLGFAQSDNSGTYSGLFLKANLSPRVSGLGGSFVALADDENALLYNPAGLANLSLNSTVFNHTNWIEDISFENVISSYNINSSLGFAFGISFLNMPSIQGRNANGPTNERFTINSNIIQVGVGYKFRPGYNVGLGVKYFNEDLAGFSGNGLAFDVGYQMPLFLSGLHFGLAAQNIGGKIKHRAVEEPIPLVIRLGLSYSIPIQKLKILLDVVKPADQDVQTDFGVEWSFKKFITLRVGNQISSEKSFAPTFGFGLNYGAEYLIDYTFDNNLELGTTHRVGITFRFNSHDNSNSYTKPITKYIPKAPSGLNYEVYKDKIIVNWNLIPDAKYNVYVKSDSQGSWKKIKSEIDITALELKKPSQETKYYLTVTAVVNGEESSFGNEIQVISK